MKLVRSLGIERAGERPSQDSGWKAKPTGFCITADILRSALVHTDTGTNVLRNTSVPASQGCARMRLTVALHVATIIEGRQENKPLTPA